MTEQRQSILASSQRKTSYVVSILDLLILDFRILDSNQTIYYLLFIY